jgi:hypothetical protein
MYKDIEIEKMGSVISGLKLPRRVRITENVENAGLGDVVAVRALTESSTYGNIELPSGRLAKINAGDVLMGALGRRRALKGFVGDIPESVKAGDRLHLLNMGGVMGICTGHHSSLSDAIELEVLGVCCDEFGSVINIADNALPSAEVLNPSAPILMVAGTCMNSGKTVAATELIKQAAKSGLKVAGAKLSGIACLRDTLHMQDHGAIATASFLDCGLPSTVDHPELPSVAKGIINHLNEFGPDLIVIELGDGIVGGYAVDAVLTDPEIRDAIGSFIFCASDYVGAFGGIRLLENFGIDVDVVAGSVTDSAMGEQFLETNFAVRAGNARRDGKRLFELATARMNLVRDEAKTSTAEVAVSI